MIVEGDSITIDLTGSNAEVPTGYNVPVRGQRCSSARTTPSARSCSTRSTFPEHVPQNDGIFRPVNVIAPKGSIFNPNFPRACFSRFCQVQRVVDNTILALADALPDEGHGRQLGGDPLLRLLGLRARTSGEYWLYLEVNEGSYGGRHGKDAHGLASTT